MRTVWVSFDTIGRDCLAAAADVGAEVVGVVTLHGPIDPRVSTRPVGTGLVSLA